MPYYVVSNYKIVSDLSKSSVFKTDLGYSSTLPNPNGIRKINGNDEFAASYNTFYKTTISKKGRIGDIHFYTDGGINENVLAFYKNYEEFIYEYNPNYIRDFGIDAYIGHLLKRVDQDYVVRTKKEDIPTQEEVVTKPQGNSDILVKNPGAVTYADLAKYLEEKRKKDIG
jgi:hypothetical protein